MSLGIRKDNQNKTVEPILNNGMNIYEPLCYTSNGKLYSPLNPNTKISWSYRNFRDSVQYPTDITTTSNNDYWQYWGQKYVNSDCCVDPNGGKISTVGGATHSCGLNFSKFVATTGTYTYNFMSGNGTNASDTYSTANWWNHRRRQYYRAGNATDGYTYTALDNILFPSHLMSADQISNRTLETNALISIDRKLYKNDYESWTSSFDVSRSWNWKINNAYIWVQGPLKVTANLYPPRYSLGMGYKGGNITKDDVSPGGIITAGSAASVYTSQLHSIYISTTKSSTGTSTRTDASRTWTAQCLGEDPNDTGNDIWKLHTLIPFGTFYGNNYRPSSFSTPIFGLKHPPFGTAQYSTWIVSAKVSAKSATNSGGPWTNFTANTYNRYLTTGGNQGHYYIDDFAEYMVNEFCKYNSLNLTVYDACWGIY